MAKRIVLFVSIVVGLSLNIVLSQPEPSPLWTLNLGGLGILTIACSQNNGYIVAGCDETVYFIDNRGNIVWEFFIGVEVASVDISSDSYYIVAAASRDNGIYCFDRLGKLLWHQNSWYNEHDSYIRTVRISDNGKFVAVGTFGGVYFLDARDGFIRWYRKIEANVYAVSISEDGEYVAALSESEGNIVVINRHSDLIWEEKIPGSAHETLISSNKNYIAIPSFDGNLYLYGINGELLWKYASTNGENFYSVDISKDERYVIAGSVWYIYLLEITGTLVFKFHLKGEVGDVCISDDGRYIVCRSSDENIYVLNNKGNLLWKFYVGGYLNDTFDYVDISSNGECIVAFGHEEVFFFDRFLRKPEFQITTDPSNQWGTQIYDNIVIWKDSRNGNDDIYGYDLSKKEEFQITSNPSNQYKLAIYGNFIAWQDDRDGIDVIYGYNLATGKEFKISEGIDVAIYEDIVVWEDRKDNSHDIYGYNLSTGREFEITTNTNDQFHPRIYKNIVIWLDHRDGHDEIYGKDLSIGQEFRVTREESEKTSLAIYEDIIVWIDERNGYEDIYGYDLSTKEEFQITAVESNKEWLAIYRNIIIWSDKRSGNWDIYGYNLLTLEEFQITEDLSDQWHPAVYGNIVVWADDRNGEMDIFGCELSTPLSLISTDSTTSPSTETEAKSESAGEPDRTAPRHGDLSLIESFAVIAIIIAVPTAIIILVKSKGVR